jgi:hypothetical protein
LSRKIGVVPTVLIAGLAFALGVGTALARARHTANRDLLSVALASELAQTSVCTNALMLQAKHDAARATKLLERQLDATLRRIEQLMDRGARLEGSVPNLRESARRAAAYWSSVGQPVRQAQAERVVAGLERG